MRKESHFFRQFRVSIVGIILVIAAGAGAAADALTTGPEALDGLQFAGETGEDGKRGHHQDTISFSEGMFRSLDCEQWGFSAAPYQVRREGDAYHFTATLVSADRGTLEWRGRIAGDKATASFRWLHERWYWNIDRRYWFRGTRQAGR